MHVKGNAIVVVGLSNDINIVEQKYGTDFPRNKWKHLVPVRGRNSSGVPSALYT